MIHEDEVVGEYHLYPTHVAFDYFWNIFISISVMTAALCAVRRDRVVGESDFMGLGGFAFGVRFRVFELNSTGLISGGARPEFIPLVVDFNSHPEANKNWVPDIRSWLNSILTGGHVSMWERVGRRMPQSRHEVMLSRAVRNCVSHDGRFFLKPDFNGSVNGFSFSSEMNGANLVDVFGPGDFLFLSLLTYCRQSR